MASLCIGLIIDERLQPLHLEILLELRDDSLGLAGASETCCCLFQLLLVDATHIEKLVLTGLVCLSIV